MPSIEIRKLKKKLREIELLKSKDLLNNEQLTKLCKENEIKNKLQELEVFFEFNKSKNISKQNAEVKNNSKQCKYESKSKKKKAANQSDEEDDMTILEKYKYSENNELWNDFNINQVTKNNTKKHQALLKKKQDEIKLEAYFKYKSNEYL